MTKIAAHPHAAECGPDSKARGILTRLAGYITAQARWLISAAVALVAPLLMIAESTAEPIVQAMVCFGNGSLMTLAASANALTLMH